MDNDFNSERRELDQDLWELEKRQSIRNKFETILKLYSLFGLVIAVFGIAYFVLTTLDINLTNTQQIALVISGTGLALSVTSWALLVMRRERITQDVKRLQSMQNLSEFIWKWSKFEAISKEALKEYDKEFNKYSIREVIEQLHKIGFINKADILSLEEAIQARNMAVHQGGIFPKEVISRYSAHIDEIIDKLQHAENI